MTTAVLEGLYDPATRKDTLTSLNDQDLMLAAFVQNETPIHPGTDELNAAQNFAELWFHANSEYAKDSIAQSSVRFVDPLLVGAATSKLLGWSGPGNSWAYHLHELPESVTMRRAIFTALFTTRHRHLPLDTEWGPDAVLQFARVIDDPAVLVAFAKKPIPYSSYIAVARTLELGSEEACDALLTQAPPTNVNALFHLVKRASSPVLREYAKNCDPLIMGYIEGTLERREA
jgi:hypothetical protein